MIDYFMQSIRKFTGMTVQESQRETSEEKGLFEYILDTGTFRHLCTTVVPDLLNVVPQTLNALGQSLQKESDSDQTKDLSDLIQRLNIHKWVETFSTWLEISHTVQSENPHFLSQHLGRAVETFLMKIDFAVFKDVLKQSAEDMNALSENINSVLWNYPAKMVLLCSIIPLAGNTACLIARNTLKHFNAVPPDALTDIIISLIKEINIEQFSDLINESAELIRKIHTGSALIGEPGYDALTQQLNRIFGVLSSTLDKETLKKARQAIWKIKTAFRDARMDAITNDPEQLADTIHQWFVHHQQTMKNLNYFAEIVDNLPDELLSETIGNHIQDMDLSEGAETINIIVRQIFRLNKIDPEGFQTALFQWIDALDMNDLESLAEQLSPQAMEQVAPIIQRIGPPVINAFCDAMEKNEAFNMALHRLKNEIFAK
jgi:hypothetical protein